VQAPPLPDGARLEYVVRSHQLSQWVTGALFSPDMTHRYALWRIWGEGQYVTFCGLNPSTADDLDSDPTCTREIRFAQSWGFAGYVKVNAFSIRSTDWRGIKTNDSHRPETAAAIRHYVRVAGLVVVCWGVHGAHEGRGAYLTQRMRQDGIALYAFRECTNGEPMHPLYLPNSSTLHEYTR
jgi:hypothetical protein